MNQALYLLAAISETLSLARDYVVRLLQVARSIVLLLGLVLQKTSFEGPRRVKVYLLSHKTLLVLEHLLSNVAN